MLDGCISKRIYDWSEKRSQFGYHTLLGFGIQHEKHGRFFLQAFLLGYSRICYSVGMKLISVEYIKLQDINKCSAEAESNILGSAYFCLAE